MKQLILVGLNFLFFTFLGAQYPRDLIDVEKYHLKININDSTDVIHAEANVDVYLKGRISAYHLDLVQQDENGKGMKVHSMVANGDTLQFHQQQNAIIFSPEKFPQDSMFRLEIRYSGIPKDGLIISKNKFGNRTFFGDNWPNRAHHWFPCNDHPSDKAFVSYDITCPAYYDVTANGKLIKENEVDGLKNFQYETIVPIPTKVMVFGAAKFSYKALDPVENIPVSMWMYPENDKKGFNDFALAGPILKFFMDKIGPYPYAKLANVQSTTRFGGMENAGNIFYSENAVKGDRSAESLIAHEIVHQWFGNSASESDWPHLWLSEGFATYLTHVCMHEQYGDEVFKKRLKADRKQIIDFSKEYFHPVVDSTAENLMVLLNANSYQKGGWFLHMLHHKVGEEIFWKGVRNYYKKYTLSNATTEDFIRVMEAESGLELMDFAHQWLRNPGHPQLKIAAQFKKSTVILELQQMQEFVFDFPIEVMIIGKDNQRKKITLKLSEKNFEKTIELDFKPTEVQWDPEVKLLFEQVE